MRDRNTNTNTGDEAMKAKLIGTQFDYDTNEHGEMAWMVTPFFRRNSRVVSVPDTRGWPTLPEAEAHAKTFGWVPTL